MRRICILLIMLLLATVVFAQNNAFIGRYNGSKPELAQELIILPDGHFLFSLSYGEVDRLIKGTWKIEGNLIKLDEQKEAIDPFIIYGRHSESVEKGKLFAFRDYSQNTSIAFSFADEFAADSFKLLYLWEQSVFSRTERLNVISKPVTKFFLSRSASEHIESDSCKVYAFEPAPELNEFMLFYSKSSEEPSVSIKAILKDKVLYVKDDSGKESLFGVKEELSGNIESFNDYFKDKARLPPDTLSLPDSTGRAFTYRLVKSNKNFSAILRIPTNEAYFKREEEVGDAAPATTNPVMSLPPPAIPSKAVHKKKRKGGK